MDPASPSKFKPRLKLHVATAPAATLAPPDDKLPITISSACIAFGFNANRYVYYGYSFPLSMTFMFRKADGGGRTKEAQ